MGQDEQCVWLSSLDEQGTWLIRVHPFHSRVEAGAADVGLEPGKTLDSRVKLGPHSFL